MNHLAHLLCAGDDPGLLAGAFLGDHHKGRLENLEPAYLRPGVALHRAIDAFADSHPVTLRSRERFDPAFRRVGGIMVDIIYDHLLAGSWQDWQDEPVTAFSERSLGAVLAQREHLPDTVIKTSERLLAHGSLPRYADTAFVARSFTYLSGRISRANPLADAMPEFTRHRDGLARDFEAFFPELLEYTHDWKHHRTI